jgi:hypothetical protein
MAEPGEPTPGGDPAAGSLRELTERFLLAGLGLLSATKDQAQEAIGTAGEGPPLRERATTALGAFLDELGFVRRERCDELELKVAQLEHRLRLVEGKGEARAAAAPKAPGRDGEAAR